jgi:hypothetical protein
MDSPGTRHADGPALWQDAGLEPPIFLDRDGRRRRLLRPLGALVSLLAAGWLAAILLGPVGFAALPPLVPAAAGGHPPAELPLESPAAEANEVAAGSALRTAREAIARPAEAPRPATLSLPAHAVIDADPHVPRRL